jgi:hypothetical protein
MRIRQVLIALLFLTAIVLLALAIVPKVRGGHFNRDYLFPGVILLTTAFAARRRLQRRAART